PTFPRALVPRARRPRARRLARGFIAVAEAAPRGRGSDVMSPLGAIAIKPRASLRARGANARGANARGTNARGTNARGTNARGTNARGTNAGREGEEKRGAFAHRAVRPH